MGKGILFFVVWIFIYSIGSSQDLNFNTAVVSSTLTDEQLSGSMPIHVGYNVGLDVILRDGATVIMPGLHFQKISLFPESLDLNKPYAKFSSRKEMKLTMQVGGFVFKNKFAHLLLHGGPAASYVMDIDSNNKYIDEDFNQIRASGLIGASLRLLFITFHINYEYGFSRLLLEKNPSGIVDNSKERAISFGLGVYF